MLYAYRPLLLLGLTLQAVVPTGEWNRFRKPMWKKQALGSVFSYNAKATIIKKGCHTWQSNAGNSQTGKKAPGGKGGTVRSPQVVQTGLRLPSTPAWRHGSFQVPASPVWSQAANSTVRSEWLCCLCVCWPYSRVDQMPAGSQAETPFLKKAFYDSSEKISIIYILEWHLMLITAFKCIFIPVII